MRVAGRGSRVESLTARRGRVLDPRPSTLYPDLIDQRHQPPFTAATFKACPQRHGDRRGLPTTRDHVAPLDSCGRGVSFDHDIRHGPIWRHGAAFAPEGFESFALVVGHSRIQSPGRGQVTRGEGSCVRLNEARDLSRGIRRGTCDWRRWCRRCRRGGRHGWWCNRQGLRRPGRLGLRLRRRGRR